MKALRPWLLLPATLSHTLSPHLLPLLSRVGTSANLTHRPFSWKNQNFSHPLGLAGGVDKNGINVMDWQRLGASFVEVGTVTPRAQSPNPPPLLMRDLKHQALWNKLGFPNKGADVVAQNLDKIRDKIQVPLWINLGKNRDTSNDEALHDYARLFSRFKSLASTFVINVSSPNTSNLRDLQSEDFLSQLMTIYRENDDYSKIPILLKLSPDMDEGAFKNLLEVGSGLGVDGWILTNTTKAREKGLTFPLTEGGVSGAPLREQSVKTLRWAVQTLGTKEAGRQSLLVSVGGIMTEKDVLTRIQLGADLVQAYSALVFNGPFFFRKTVKKLSSSQA